MTIVGVGQALFWLSLYNVNKSYIQRNEMVFVCALQSAPSHCGKLHFGYPPELYLSLAS